MADDDEIPVSKAEQAFFDAMKAVQGVQDEEFQREEVGTRVEDDDDDDHDPSTVMTSTDDAPTTNGHDGSDRERPASMEERATEEAEVKEVSSAAPSTRNSVAPSATPSATTTPAAPATTATPDLSSATPAPEVLESAQAQSAPNTPVIPQASEFGAPVQAAQSQQPAQSQKAVHSGKRKRLPQDLVGQLEDRIAEDPRGDLDAWLSLISEHKRKGKFDDARNVYERFFVLFPQSVSLPSPPFLPRRVCG